LTTSPIETIPTTSPPSTTGTWRIRRSVIKAMHSSIGVSGFTTIRGEDMISPTVTSSPVGPLRATRRR
jgi:hypothetical protein